MKKTWRIISLILVAVMICTIMPVSGGVWNSANEVYAQNQGTEYGTKDNPYLIGSQDDIEKIRQNPSAYFKLTADITMSDTFNPIPSFSGVLDGDGHSISGIAVRPAVIANTRKGTGNLFDTISSSGVVKNLTLASPNVGIYMQNENRQSYNENAAALARINKGTVDNVSINDLSITVSFFSGNSAYDVNNFPESFGGLIGINEGTISNITMDNFTFRIPSNVTQFGGICGINKGNVKGVVINNSSFETGTRHTDGSMEYSECSPCVGYNTGTITLAWVTMYAYVYEFATTRGDWTVSDIGAVCGRNAGTVSKSYAKITNKNTTDYQVHGIGNTETASVTEGIDYADNLYNVAAAFDSSIYTRTNGRTNVSQSAIESEYGYVTISLEGTVLDYKQLCEGSVDITLPGANTDDKYVLYTYEGKKYKIGDRLTIQVDDTNKAGFTLDGEYYDKGRFSVKADESMPFVTMPQWSEANTEFILPSGGFAAADENSMKNVYPHYYYMDKYSKAGEYSPKLYCSWNQFVSNGVVKQFGSNTISNKLLWYYYVQGHVQPDKKLTLAKRSLKSYNLRVTGITNNKLYAGEEVTYTIDVIDTQTTDTLFEGTFALYNGEELLASTTVSGNSATVSYIFEAGIYNNLKLKLTETEGKEKYNIPALPSISGITVLKKNPANCEAYSSGPYVTNYNKLPSTGDLYYDKASSYGDAVGEIDYSKPIMYDENGTLVDKPSFDGMEQKYRFYVYVKEGSAYEAGYMPVQGNNAYITIKKYDLSLSYDYDAAAKVLSVHADGSGRNSRPDGTYAVYIDNTMADSKTISGLSAMDTDLSFSNVDITAENTAYILYTPTNNGDANLNFNETKLNISTSGASGNCGASGRESELTWRCENGVLTIEGANNVKMMDYTEKNGRSTAPWSTCIYNKVVINGGSYIGDYAFFNGDSRKSLEVEFGSGANITNIGECAFSGRIFDNFAVPDSVIMVGYDWLSNSYVKNLSIGKGFNESTLYLQGIEFEDTLTIPAHVKTQVTIGGCKVKRIVFAEGFNGTIKISGNTGLRLVERPVSSTRYGSYNYTVEGTEPLSVLHRGSKLTNYFAEGNAYAVLTAEVDLSKITSANGDKYSSNIVYLGDSDSYQAYIERAKSDSNLGYIHHMIYVDGNGSRTCNKNYEAHYECAPDCQVCSKSLYLDADMCAIMPENLAVDSDNVRTDHTYNEYGRCSTCGEYGEITVSAQEKEYDGKEITVKYNCDMKNVTASYQYQCIENWVSGDDAAIKDGLPKDAGTYRIDVTLTSGNAVLKKSIDSVTIKPRRIEITGITLDDFYYKGKNEYNSASIKSIEGTGMVEGEKIPCSGKEYEIRAIYTDGNAGCNTVQLTFKAASLAMGTKKTSPNYYTSPEVITFEVNPIKPLPITITSQETQVERDYLGEDINISELGISCSPVDSTKTLKDKYKSYSYTSEDESVVKVNGDKIEVIGGGTTYVTVGMSEKDNFEYEPLKIKVVVNRIPGSGTVSIEDWGVDEPVGAIEVESDTNGITDVTYYFKERNADDSTYTTDIPNTEGEYTIKAVFAQTKNYLECEAFDDFVIKAVFTGNTSKDMSTMVANSGECDLSEFDYPSDYTVGAPEVQDADGVFDGAPYIQDGKVYYTMADDVAKIGKTGSIRIPVSSNDYAKYYIILNVTMGDKMTQSGFAFAEPEIDKTYGDAAFVIEAEGNATGSTVTYESDDDSIATVDPATGEVTIVSVGSGSVIIKATASETATYNEKTVEYILNVEKKTLTPHISCDGKIYDGDNAADVTYSLDGVVDGDDVLLTGTSALYDSEQAGNRTVIATGLSISGADVDNYKLASTTAQTTATITRQNINVAITASDCDYTGSQICPSVNITAPVTLIEGTDYELVYGENVNAGTAAGSVTIKALDTSNYTFDDVTTYFNINKVIYSGVDSVSYEIKIGGRRSFDFASVGIPDGGKIEAVTVVSGAELISSYKGENSILTCSFVNDKANIGNEAVIKLTISSTNYVNYEMTVTIKAVAKDIQDKLAFPQTKVTKKYGDEAFVIEAKGAAEGSRVTYSVDSQSPQDVVNVDASTGKVTILKASSVPVIIVATAAETEDYYETSVSYALVVNKSSKPAVQVDEAISITPSGTTASLADVKLPAGWYFSQEDMSKKLIPGSVMEFTAHYDGDDNHEPAKQTVRISCLCQMVNEESQKEYRIGMDDKLVLVCSGDINELKGIKMDDKDVDASAYSLTEGSTIVTFKKEYMDSLSVGQHVVTMYYPSNTVTFKINVIKDDMAENSDKNANTGDTMPVMLLITMLAMCGIGLVALKERCKRR